MPSNTYGTNYGTVPFSTWNSLRRRSLRHNPLLRIFVLFLSLCAAIVIWLSDARIYPGAAHWSIPTFSHDCFAVGVRETTATLQAIPSEWLDWKVEACHLVSLPIATYQNGEERSTRFPDRCRLEKINGVLTVIGAWDVQDDSCMPTWYPSVPEDCVDIDLRSYSARVQYIPPGLDSHDACEKSPVLLASGEALDEKHCTLSDDGTFVAHGIAKSDYCEPSLASSQSKSTCSAVGERDYVSTVVVPSGLDPIHACELTEYTVHGTLTPPKRCTFSSDGVSVEASWHIVDDAECTPVWETSPIPDRKCQAYGTRKYSSIMSPLPGLDMQSTCLQTFATVKRETTRQPDDCEEMPGGRMKGTWIIDFDEPGCISELAQVQDKVRLYRHVYFAGLLTFDSTGVLKWLACE